MLNQLAFSRIIIIEDLIYRLYFIISNGMIPVLNVSTFSIQKMVNTSYTAITTIAIL